MADKDLADRIAAAIEDAEETSDDELHWVRHQDPGRWKEASYCDHLVYVANIGHYCSMCCDPATHKVGEERPTIVPDNATDLLILAGHNMTNWLCCLHFRVAIGDCGDRRTLPDYDTHRS